MIDINRIKENLEIFSFPRLSGTDHEKKAFTILKKKIDELNLNLSVQNFSFSTFYPRVYPKIASILTFWILFILYLNIQGYFTLVNFIIVFSILIPLFIITRKPEKIRIGKVLDSQNLIIKIFPNTGENNSNNVIFNEKENNIFLMSHIDSKGQRFSILARIRTIRIWVFSAFVAFFIIILKNYIITQFSLLFYIIGAIPLFFNLLAIIVINLNTTNNNSNGAIDDASGIAIVLELLNYYSNPEHRFNSYNLWFFFTGAEECGTSGIRHLYNNEIKHLDRKTSIPINFDAIGKTIYMFPNKKLAKTNGTFLSSFIKNSKALNVKENPKKIYFGSHSDGYFLKKKDFIGIGFGDMESYKFIHSVNDTIDKINPKLLAGLCKAITISLNDLDSNT